jgi:hypothetical protein
VADALLESVDLARGVRLLGVSLSGLVDPGEGTQLRLDLDTPPTGAGPVGGPGGVERPGSGVRAGPGTVRDASREAERLQQSWGSVTSAVDAIRARYGGSAVGPASLVTPEGIKVRQRGEAQWGPSRPDEPPARDGPRRDAPDGA